MIKKDKYGCIYIITCLINNKYYIGQHNKLTPDSRWKSHLGNAKRGDRKYPIYNAMNRNGIENFIIDTLCIVPITALNKYESYFVNLLQTYVWDKPGGYNYAIAEGGTPPITEITRQKLSDSHKGKIRSKESLEKLSESLKESHKNKELWEPVYKAISKTLKGKSNLNWGSHTAEINAKISSTLKGKAKTLEHNSNVMSSAYHTKPGESGQRYILKNKHGYYVRINNKKYGIFGKQFKTLEEAINARDNFTK